MKITRKQLKQIIKEALATSPSPDQSMKDEEDDNESTSKSPDSPKADMSIGTLPKGRRLDEPQIDENQYDANTENFYWKSNPPKAALAAAKKEANLWEKGTLLSPERKKKLRRTYMLEGDKEAYAVLKKYWDHTGLKEWHQHSRKNSEGKKVEGTAWSAAFVSWCMSKSDGEGPTWDISVSHQDPDYGGYLHKAWERRREVEENPDKYLGKTLYLAFSGKEIIGNKKSNKFSTINPKHQYAAKTNHILPGDVVGIRQSDGWLHMDIYAGGGKKIGGNTYNASRVVDTSGFATAKLSRVTDIIKRVTVVASVEKLPVSEPGRTFV